MECETLWLCMWAKLHVPKIYSGRHSYGEIYTGCVIGGSHLHILYFIIVFQGHWHQSCGWLSIDYFLYPQSHSYLKVVHMKYCSVSCYSTDSGKVGHLRYCPGGGHSRGRDCQTYIMISSHLTMWFQTNEMLLWMLQRICFCGSNTEKQIKISLQWGKW